jgi:hypothetical protein
LPLKFPDRHEEMRQRCQAFQRLSPDDRWREIAALFAFGWATVKASPRRAAIEARMEEQERDWQRIQKELFARYAADSPMTERDLLDGLAASVE